MSIPLLFAKRRFNPRRLFAAGEQGAWYDVSDLSTLFQDSAGTTPVTAVGGPVGLILDKSGRGNHASQTTTISRPILRQDEAGRYYLEFDGTDDWLQTGTINFGSTNKMSVFAGVRKQTNSNNRIVCSVANGTASSLNIFAPRADNLFGTSSPYTNFAATLAKTSGVGVDDFAGHTTPNNYAAPLTAVLSVNADRSINNNGACILRVNAIVPSNNTSATGANSANPANFGSANPILLSSSAFPFNGRLYAFIARGALTSSPQLEQVERWVAAKTGVTL